MFARSVEKRDAGTSHLRAHFFGRAVYEVLGLEGLKVCDERFNSGCLHGFYAAAMTEQGDSVLNSFSDTCKKSEFVHRCYHGIGHGLVTWLGYDEQAMVKAAEFCRDAVGDETEDGCVSGAVMEFDVKTLSYPAAPLRILTSENSFEPCNSLPMTARPACFFTTPAWWIAWLTGHDGLHTAEAFRKAAPLCDGISQPQYRESCRRGLGNIAATYSGFERTTAERLCGTLNDASAATCKNFADFIIGATNTASGMDGAILDLSAQQRQ